ncbi:Cof-type HAD-IIB family hydrolase [Dialister sp.]|uniref:Cof-type HAD-IIB family hydrolase n=1 Tax=Dialister sp. TaxID=1955814 RepID=UPI002E812938|nr:Cof-type HAD-IIB family hydrolase [Dialister sp.]MEE3453504.1 Cof-type HAD-IIB family hydrolase [Dialister sp.]
MSIKLIAIDLDDTLLRDDISISDYTKKTLRAALSKGVRIVIATGRMFQAARPWGQAIGLGDVPMICYTGALTGLCESGKIIRNVTVEKDAALDILSTIKEEGWYAHTYIDDELHVPYYDWRTRSYEKQCGVKAHVDGEAFYHPEKEPTKILVCEYYDKKMKEIDGVLRKKYGGAVNQVKSKPYFFEMNNKECSKGNAIRAMCELYGISIRDTMTFGNGNNDVSMLSMTPWSFAVANASDSAKKAAAHETFSNNEDGVARAVEKYVLED